MTRLLRQLVWMAVLYAVKAGVYALFLGGVIYALVELVILPEAQRLADEKHRQVVAQVQPLDPATEKQLRRAGITLEFAAQAIARIEKRVREFQPCPCQERQK